MKRPSVEEMEDACLTSLVKRYLPLLRNIRQTAVPLDERVVLNLRKREWPEQYMFFYRNGWTRILGIEVNWL